MSAAETAIYHGRKAIGASGTAEVLENPGQEVDWICVSAPFMNKGAMFLGNGSLTGWGSTPATGDGYMLMPGKEVRLGSLHTGELYIEGTKADCVYWIASSGYKLPV